MIRSLRQSIIVFLMCVIAFLSGCSSDYDAERAYWHFMRIHAATMKDPAPASIDDFKNATEALRGIVRKFPRWKKAPELQLILAQMYVSRGELDRAEMEYRNLISTFPQQHEVCAVAQYSIGALTEQQGRVKDAAVEFLRIIDLYPTTTIGLKMPAHMVSFRRRHGTVSDIDNAFQQAMRHYQNLIETNPFSDMVPAVQEVMVTMCVDNQRAPDAVKALQSFVDTHTQAPACPNALLSLAHLYRVALKQPDRAIAVYEQIINAPPSKQAKTALLELTGMLAIAGNRSKAYDQVQTAGKRYPADSTLAASMRAAIAYSYELAGQWPQAEKELRAIMQAYPETSPALQMPLAFISHAVKSGNIDEQANALQEALAYYGQVIQRTRNKAVAAEAQEMSAAAYMLVEKYPEALYALRVLREQYPSDDRAPMAKLKMAAIYENNQNDIQKTLAAYRQFLVEYPLHKLAYYARSQIERIRAAEKKSDNAKNLSQE